MNEQQRKALIVEISMQMAHIRQYLRDASERMDEVEKNHLLDRMLRLKKLLNELEKES